MKNGDGQDTSYRLVVSIINYRTASMTWACVQSVLADLKGRDDALIVIVDNASGDGSEVYLAARIKELPAGGVPVHLVQSPRNDGFSSGHNQGMAVAKAEYYLILNSDALLRPGFCAAMLKAGDDAPADIGLLSPRIENEDGTQHASLFRFPGPASEIIRGAMCRPVSMALHRWDVPLSVPAASDQIGWASFACILLRGSMVSRIGPMDEGYFLYFEDVEYCLRARRAGWRIAHVENASAMHLGGGSGDVPSFQSERKRLPRYFYASRSRFMRQAHGGAGPAVANIGWMIGRVLARLKWLYGKRAARANLAEGRDIWIGALRARKDDGR